jgi:hypothetical protein
MSNLELRNQALLAERNTNTDLVGFSHSNTELVFIFLLVQYDKHSPGAVGVTLRVEFRKSWWTRAERCENNHKKSKRNKQLQ